MKALPPPRAVAAYDPGLRTLHWLMAALIFAALPLGVWASLLPSGGRTRIEVLFFHKSIGVTVLGLIALRIVWRLFAGAPAYADPFGKLTQLASRAGHLALYAVMIAMPVGGYLASTAGGKAVLLVRAVRTSKAHGQGQVRRRGGELGAFRVCLHACVRAGRPSRGRRMVRGDQARFRAGADVAELSAGRPPTAHDHNRPGGQEPVKECTALIGQASASGSACTTWSVSTDAVSLFHPDRMTGERTTPTPTR
jgi:cytochrome b561